MYHLQIDYDSADKNGQKESINALVENYHQQLINLDDDFKSAQPDSAEVKEIVGETATLIKLFRQIED